MSDATLIIDGKEYVVVPKRRYDRLTREERDRKDAAIAARVTKAIKEGRIKTIPLEEARKGWGV